MAREDKMQSEYLTEHGLEKQPESFNYWEESVASDSFWNGAITNTQEERGQFLFLFLCSLLIFVVFFEILGLRLFVCLCIWPYVFTTQLQPTTLTIFI